MTPTEPLLVFPDPPPPELAQALDLAGYRVEGGRRRGRRRRRPNPTTVGPGPSSCADADPKRPSPCAGPCASATSPSSPLLLLVSGAQLADLELRDDLFDDFCLWPVPPPRARGPPPPPVLAGRPGDAPELVEYGDLVLNLETYQAAIDGRPLDLTYMEYELLKFLAQHPGKVFTRETLLSRVWGYEYYGGARTVDVHVRRLRAKLGEEHANLIQTVRSVGYRFGQTRWSL